MGLLSGGKQKTSTTHSVPQPLRGLFSLTSNEAQRLSQVPVPQQQVAGLSPYELSSLQGLGATARGDFLGSNPYLDQYFDQASRAVTDAYRYGTAPQTSSQISFAGHSPVSSAGQEWHAMNRFGLGENLRNLASQIYMPAYQAERGYQEGATRDLMSAGGQSRAVEQAQLNLPYTNYLSQFAPLQALQGAYGSLSSTPFDVTSTQRNNMGLGQALLGAGLVGGSFYTPSDNPLNTAQNASQAINPTPYNPSLWMFGGL